MWAAAIAAASTVEPRVEPNGWIVLSAGGVALVGIVWIAVLAVLNQPRRPRPGPTTMDLPPESPAVVDLITNPAMAVTEEAAVSTLIDLAARRWILIERGADGAGICRVRNRPGVGALSAVDDLILTHVRSLARGGIVPLAALTTGDEASSTAWWKRFRRAVEAEATTAGYVRRRWSRRSLVVSWLASLTSGGLIYAAFATLPDNTQLQPTVPLGVAAALTVTVWTLNGRVSASGALRDTDVGHERGGVWLGVQRFLADHGQFDDQPAAAVAVWNRYLSSAVALGLGRTILREVPLGAEDDHRAWSTASGRWRIVHVRYPRFRPGWGRQPLFAVVMGLLGVAIGGGAVAGATWLVDDQLASLELTKPPPQFVFTTLDVAAVVVTGFGTLLVLWSVLQLLGGAIDLFARQEVEGLVVRRRTHDRITPGPPHIVRWASRHPYHRVAERELHYLALDRGDDDRIVAWRISVPMLPHVQQGLWARVSVTRVLRRVRTLEPISTPPMDTGRPDAAGFDPATADANLRRLAAAAATMTAEAAAATQDPGPAA